MKHAKAPLSAHCCPHAHSVDCASGSISRLNSVIYSNGGRRPTSIRQCRHTPRPLCSVSHRIVRATPVYDYTMEHLMMTAYCIEHALNSPMAKHIAPVCVIIINTITVKMYGAFRYTVVCPSKPDLI